MLNYRAWTLAALIGFLAFAGIGAGPVRPVAVAPPLPTPPRVVADVPANKEWDVDEASATFTGGGKGATTIELVLDKAAVSGRTLSVQSDGDHLMLGGAEADVRVMLAVDRKAPGAADNDGSISTLQLVAGDHPSIAFNDHDWVRETGHWRRIAHDPGRTFKLSVVNATFAIVKFPPVAPPVVAAPAPSAAPSGKGVAPPPAAGVLELVIKPVKLQALGRDFANAVAKPCLNCHGTGHVTRQVQVGSRQQGIFSTPIMQNQTFACAVCDQGVVRGPPDVILRKTAALVHGLIGVDRSADHAQDVLKSTYDLVTQNAIGDNRAWTILTKDARSTLSVASPQVGTALIAEVFVDSAWTDDHGARMFRAHLPGTTNQFVIENPPTADNVNTGPVLMGGIIDRPLAPDVADPGTTAIRGAFVLAPDIDRRWTWWVYHDAYRPHP